MAKRIVLPVPLGLPLKQSITTLECNRTSKNSIVLNVPKLCEILEALEVDTEEFFYDDFDNYKKDKEILGITKSLSKEELEDLILLLKRK